MRAPAPLVGLLALGAALALAGCTTVRSDAGVSNFDLRPERVGWNVSDEARFTLAIKAGLIGDEPDYEIDRDFAIEEILLHERGFSPNGNFRTKDPGAVELKLWRGGEEVASAILTQEAPSVGLSITLPDSLRDSEYSLELELFKVGRVKSDAFRVNVP